MHVLPGTELLELEFPWPPLPEDGGNNCILEPIRDSLPHFHPDHYTTITIGVWGLIGFESRLPRAKPGGLVGRSNAIYHCPTNGAFDALIQACTRHIREVRHAALATQLFIGNWRRRCRRGRVAQRSPSVQVRVQHDLQEMEIAKVQ